MQFFCERELRPRQIRQVPHHHHILGAVSEHLVELRLRELRDTGEPESEDKGIPSLHPEQVPSGLHPEQVPSAPVLAPSDRNMQAQTTMLGARPKYAGPPAAGPPPASFTRPPPPAGLTRPRAGPPRVPGAGLLQT